MTIRTAPFAAVLIGLALITGCSSTIDRQPGNAAPAGSPSVPGTSPVTGVTTASPSPSTAGTATSPAAKASGRCHTNQLHGEIDLIFPAGQAGSEQDAMLGLTNTGPACTMFGYVGLQLVDANGTARTTKVVRSDNGGQSPATHFTLQHGQTAWTTIGWNYLPNPDEENSQPLCGGKVHHAQITPPDETARLTVSAEFGTVCSHGTIYVRPMSLTRPKP
jgi:hypothetical protein